MVTKNGLSPLIYVEAIKASGAALSRANSLMAHAVNSGKWPHAEFYSKQIVRHANDLRCLARLARSAEK